MTDAEYFIQHLNMVPHPEGGYFAESYLSSLTMKDYGAENVASYGGEDRKLWSSIYFLLCRGEVSHFHRLQYDELWYYHAGNALTVYTIDADGVLTAHKLGLNAAEGELPQVLVPAGVIFGSAMENEGFSLVGCLCAPCFRYEEFELFDRETLLKAYPEHAEVIRRLTPES